MTWGNVRSGLATTVEVTVKRIFLDTLMRNLFPKLAQVVMRSMYLVLLRRRTVRALRWPARVNRPLLKPRGRGRQLMDALILLKVG